MADVSSGLLVYAPNTILIVGMRYPTFVVTASGSSVASDSCNSQQCVGLHVD